MEINTNTEDAEKSGGGLKKYLSPVHIWALSFGCSVGWGAFVMPGTVFLPVAGPIGTAVAICIGAAIMLLVGYNYYYMMNRYPDAGGAYTYAKHVFGYDHAFINAWFLLLVYMSITWANATALPLIFRHLWGDFFQVGYMYNIAEFAVYLGEVALSLTALWLFSFLCMHGGKLVARMQTVLAFVLLGGVLAVFTVSTIAHNADVTQMQPYFNPNNSPITAILTIVALSPWAFSGFESISQSTEEFNFPRKKIWPVLVLSLAAGAMAYMTLTFLAMAAVPERYAVWSDYIADLDSLSGLEKLPAFSAVQILLGDAGIILLTCTLLAGAITGLLGNSLAVSRLIYAMAKDKLLPASFRKLNHRNVPENALWLLIVLSLPIPFLGRTAISWVVDIATIGAIIAYAYTSAVAFKYALDHGDRLPRYTGLAGLAVSGVLFVYFMMPYFWTVNTMSTESYLILIFWGILGFAFFRYVLWRDVRHVFGHSVVVWLVLLFLIFFTSLQWFRSTTHDMTTTMLGDLSNYYVMEMEKHGIFMTRRELMDASYYLERQMRSVDDSMSYHSILQMMLISISLVIMLSVYNVMNKRQRRMEILKMEAEQSNKAKSIFLSNMSHDLRTPMNAIIGYTELLRKEPNLDPKVMEYLQKINTSSGHLLSLINDVLEMSRIESGKAEPDIAPVDLKKLLQEVKDLFATQMQEKQISYTVVCKNITDGNVLSDGKRLNRILINLIGNAYKFTPAGKAITVTLTQNGRDEKGNGKYTLAVKDTGIGMTPEFVTKIFEAYTRDRTVNNIQGSGLGMAITKSLTEMLGGTITVSSTIGQGSEFTLNFAFPQAQTAPKKEAAKEPSASDPTKVDFTGVHLLLVEDNDVNREIATLILTEHGCTLDTAVNGKDAVEKVTAAPPGKYRAVLMDIQMPIMNGYDAARAIRAMPDKERSLVPIIAMTANAFAEDIENAKAAGMNAHIAKPLDVPTMMATLAQVIKN